MGVVVDHKRGGDSPAPGVALVSLVVAPNLPAIKRGKIVRSGHLILDVAITGKLFLNCTRQ